MRKTVWVLLAFLLAAGFVWGTGGKEAGPAEAEEMVGAATTNGGTVYATLAEYEKATGKKITEFRESPAMSEKVAAGELPPVEQRLPEQPVVFVPHESIGIYGGQFVGPYAVGEQSAVESSQYTEVFELAPNGRDVIPNLVAGYTLSDDYTVLTMQLREGMKWSDGTPLTADDCLFWYNDILQNENLTPAVGGVWTAGGDLVKVTTRGDYTVRFEFAGANPSVLQRLYASGFPEMFRPKHYLSKFHPTYNADVEKLAKDEGFDSWWAMFQSKGERGERQSNLDLPVVFPWVLTDITSRDEHYYERNPYYFKIDSMGNQLPYIDTMLSLPGTETFTFKAMSGELDIYKGEMADYVAYKENEEKGDYRLLMCDEAEGSKVTYSFNQNHKDPVLREIFGDIRFRQAMSLAINRDEIKEIVYRGTGIPRQATVIPATTYYEDWMGEYFAEYDVDEANELLDEMGLKWDRNEEFRLRPDGDTLSVIIEMLSIGPWGAPQVNELVKEYWEAVGVKTTIKSVEFNLYLERGLANERDMGLWIMDSANELVNYINPNQFYPPWGWNAIFGAGVEWEKWLKTNGAEGLKPPDWAQRIYELAGKLPMLEAGTDEYMATGRELMALNVQNLVHIGTVGLTQFPCTVSNALVNVPDKGHWSGVYHFWAYYDPEQWYLKK